MSNIVPTQAVPAYLAKFATQQANLEQFGHLETSDFALNIVKIVQASSPQMRAGWGPTRSEPPLPMGTMFLSRDAKVIAPETAFIPLWRSMRYIYWDGKPGDGKLVFMTDSKDDPRIKEIDGLAFKRNPATGKNTPPLVTTFINFYIMIQGIEVPCVLSFKRTSMPAGRRLTQDLIMCTKSGTLPLFAFKFKLMAPVQVVDGNLAWHNPVIVADGMTPEEAIDKAAKMAELAKNLAAAATVDQFVESEDDHSHSDQLKNVTPPVAPTVPTAPAPATPVMPAPAVPPMATTVQSPSKLW